MEKRPAILRYAVLFVLLIALTVAVGASAYTVGVETGKGVQTVEVDNNCRYEGQAVVYEGSLVDGDLLCSCGDEGLSCQINPELESVELSEGQVMVYLYDPVDYEAGDRDYLVGVVRDASEGAGLDVVMSTLIAGPEGRELSSGLSPTFTTDETFAEGGHAALTGESNCEGADFKTSLEDGLATVQFCKQVVLAGDLSGMVIREQVQRSFFSVEGVESVRILDLEGKCFDDLKGDSTLEECTFFGE